MANSYYIKLGWSKKLSDRYIKRYNQDKELKDRLRASHISLVNILIYYYSKEIKKKTALGIIQEGQELPSLRTNNEQLSQRLGVCLKTVLNLRKRLEKANIITRTIFHGSNSSYELFLNPGIIHISMTGEPENRILFFSTSTPPQDFFSDPKRKSLPHTVTGTRQDTSKLNKLEGVDFQESPESQPVTEKNDVDKVLKPCGKMPTKLPEPPENQQIKPNQVTQDPNSGYARSKTDSRNAPQVAAHPPKEMPEFFHQVSEHLPQNQASRLAKITDRILKIAIINLYKDRWLNETEKARARAAIAEYFAFSDPEKWAAGSSEIVQRIFLVKRWIDKQEKKNNYSWTTPIPSAYFNIRNKKGFAVTKTWFKGHKQARNEINFQTTITKAVNQYLKCFEPENNLSQAETYRKISQQLGKKSKQLLDEFNRQILSFQNQ